jgi:hypothetical protein
VLVGWEVAGTNVVTRLDLQVMHFYFTFFLSFWECSINLLGNTQLITIWQCIFTVQANLVSLSSLWPIGRENNVAN